MVKFKVPTCTYKTEDDIDKESSTGVDFRDHLTLLGFHVALSTPSHHSYSQQSQASWHQPLPEQRRLTALSLR